MTATPTHGRYTTYTNHSCRCYACAYAASEYRAQLQATPEEDRRPKRAAAEHGTRSMFANQGCRCDPCRLANNAYLVGWRARRAS